MGYCYWKGDSGGPLFTPDGTLVGLVSYGYALLSIAVCQSPIVFPIPPGVFTNVGQFVSFIQGFIQ